MIARALTSQAAIQFMGNFNYVHIRMVLTDPTGSPMTHLHTSMCNPIIHLPLSANCPR